MEATAKHTPGPWYFLEGVVMPDGDTFSEGGVTIYRGEHQAVAQMVRNQADGALLAAAPTLYNLLERVLQHNLAAEFPAFATEIEDALFVAQGERS